MAFPLARDPLTQALTRQVGEQLLRQYLEQASAERPVAVIFFDLDHFKTINDAFGHAVGDEALRFAAAYFLERVEGKGALARYGGDEFIVLLPGVTRAQAEALGAAALEHFSTHSLPGEHTLYLRLSIGVAVAPEDGASVEEILRVVDRRHYFAKYSGGHRVVARPHKTARALIAFPHRPIGQREQLERLHRLMAGLPEHRSGVIRIQSPPYGGAAIFLSNAQHVARLKGYTVLALRATPALQRRDLGVFSQVWPLFDAVGLPALPESEEEVFRAIQQVVRQSRGGLLITVAHAEWLDEGSKALLQRLLNQPPGERPFALVYATLEGARADFRAPLFASIDLPPLRPMEVRAWLRHALRWEPPQSCVAWVYESTQGLPELIQPTLEALVREGYLQSGPEGWQWFPPRRWRPPRPPLSSALPKVGVPGGLPLLIGRNHDLHVLRSLLRQQPLVTVVAQGGAGKTRLLQQLALECGEEFTHGVRYITPYGEIPGRAVDLVAQALEMTLKSGQNPVEQVAEALQARHMALILDGMEALEDLGSLVQAILQRAPRVRLVVGAQQRLHLPAEHVYPLQGLATQGEDSPASRLFWYLSRRSGAQLKETPATRQAVAEICRSVQGSPLALRMIAAWTTTWSPEEILQHIRAESLQANPLGTVLDRFWAMLSATEQRTLARLALFQGVFDAQAAHYVAKASPFFLDALGAKAYLYRFPQRRFGLHGMLRHYAREKLRTMAPWVEEQAQKRHARWFLAHLPAQAGAQEEDLWNFVASEADLPDVVAAWHYALGRRDLDLLLPAAPWVIASLGDLNRFTETHLLVQESLRHLRQVPASQRDASYYALRAFLETAYGEFYYHLGQMKPAEKVLHRVECRYMPFLSPLQRAYLHLVQGKHAISVGRYPQAEAYLNQALQVYRQTRLLRPLFATLNALGIMAYSCHELGRARKFFTEALEIAREDQRPSAVAALLNNLGNLALQEGRFHEAKDLLLQALDYLGDHDAPNLRSSILDTQGRVANALGQPCVALQHLGEAVHYALLSGSVPNALEALTTTAHTWAQMGRLHEAARLVDTLWAYEELKDYNRQELAALRRRLPGRNGQAPWEEDDLPGLVQRVKGLSRRWCLGAEED